MFLNDFDFFLPQELIAQTPQVPRSSSKLLHLDGQGSIIDKQFEGMLDLCSPGDVLVLNNTKVIPALLTVLKLNEELTSALSITLIKEISKNVWQIMAKPAKKIKKGDVLSFHKEEKVTAIVLEKDSATNHITVQFYNDSTLDLLPFLLKYGRMPLPPYIKRREHNSEDFEYYQTVFASEYGAVAAPTAGLHFTQTILEKLITKGVNVQFLTLHVGLGTFSSIRTLDISQHKMHTEKFSISSDACEAINVAKKNGSKVICVGTTTLRALESAASLGAVRPCHSAETDIFIKPGYKFQIVDSLITNFHLPKSTLLILVSAFCGLQPIKHLYDYAVQKRYRFFSYGDACYLEKQRSL